MSETPNVTGSQPGPSSEIAVSNDDDLRRVRIASGFVLGPLCGAFALAAGYGVFGGGLGMFMLSGIVATICGCAFTLALSVPAYFVLRRWLRQRLIYSVLIAGFEAIAPLVLMTLVSGPSQGALTGENLLVDAAIGGPIFVAGCVSGLVFWLIAMRNDPDPYRYVRSHGAKGSRPSISS